MIKCNFKIAATTAIVTAAGMLCSAAAQATIVDLTGSTNSGFINGAQFVFTAQQPTGTGVIDPFLREQASPTEQGYNTSGGTPFDDKAGIWTHDIQLSDLQASTINISGTQYYRLLLDVNEPNGSKSLISLDSLQIYTSSIGSQTTMNVSALGTLRYNLDTGGDSYVLIDAARNHGSGSGDIYAYIPAANFAGVASSDFVYLYARFGDQQAADATSTGGFEEWAIVKNVNPVPEMNALFPIVGLMVVVLSTSTLRRRKMARISA